MASLEICLTCINCLKRFLGSSNTTQFFIGPGHVTFWRLCTDQELEKEKLAKMALKSQSNESITDHDVSTASLTRCDEDDQEEKSGVVTRLLQTVVDDQRMLIPGINGRSTHNYKQNQICYYDVYKNS